MLLILSFTMNNFKKNYVLYEKLNLYNLNVVHGDGKKSVHNKQNTIQINTSFN